ncbi:succinylglutamate desuccinylase/aspartoacylase family protein [Pigmentiphaga sp. GD03639]|uniref:succinylglutamate desuccinylase/aspartoacylase domain-containing protein n=1 Tax=Pigmentiphaga sp. GD03639 TaxID=2975354 RepID=UPI00244AD225|nr:succinylglutamate desuccinylase/aspartoacylase family protein [Pigmentiphaga sp. GD03639]MDH2235104.1 succinylglutamate desuccinylase/aspartoacylase family protein [Pigmentiphaga sp. GD03639]
MATHDFLLPVPDLSAVRAGNTGVEGVWHFDSGTPGRHVLVTSLVHGNELCGAWAVKTALESGLRPRRGKLTLAFCNLAAFDTFDAARHDASRYLDEDLNRVWSDDKLAAPTTRERARAAALLPWVRQADWLLDLHSMHEPCAPLLLTGMQPRNLDLARELGAPRHIIVDAGHKDGVRMRDYGRFGQMTDNGTRSLLIECGYHGALESRAVAQDQVARFLRASGIVDDNDIPAEWIAPTPDAQQAIEVTQPVVARSMDFRFAQPWQGLEELERAGTVIGWQDGEPVTTPYDHCTLVMPSLRQLVPGVTVVRLARRVG